MLASSKVMTFLGATDRDRARTFYEHTLGLRYVTEDPFALVFDLNGTTLRISPAPQFSPAKHTVLGWEVKDIREAVATLKSGGIVFEKYGFPGQDAEGIWSAPGGAKVAWFKDPDGNILSVSEHPPVSETA